MIIEKLHNSIEISSKELINKDLLSNQEAVNMDYAIQIKERELQSKKMTLNTHVQQHEILVNKSNDKNANEKFNFLYK